MEDSSSFSDASDFEDHSKPCSWCGKFLKLLPAKSYCQKCSDNCHKECRRCKRPFPDKKHFELDKDRCNACHRKYAKEREKRLTKKAKQDGGKRKIKDDHSGDEKKIKPNEEIQASIFNTDANSEANTSTEKTKSRIIKRGFIPLIFFDTSAKENETK